MGVSRVEHVPASRAGYGNALTRDLLSNAPAALDLLRIRPVEDVAAGIDRQSYPRHDLAAILERTASADGAPDAVLENIQRLRDDRTFVVATGQQAGFLGGPLYSLHKALSAVVQAREYSARLRRPVVPVFWLAADDHDHGEIDHAYALNAAGGLLRARAPLQPETLGCSACDLRLASDSAARSELESSLAAAIGNDVAREIVELYSQHSFSTAFARLFYRWLGGTGIVLAMSDALRALPATAGLLQRDLAGFAVVHRLVQDAGTRMQAAGYEPGFPQSQRNAPHFFIAAQARKLRAALEARDDGSFRERSSAFSEQDGPPQQYTHAQLETLLREQPRRFSASAALRPVLQQTLFPVVSAVLGPGEIAYWAQLYDVHAHFGAVWPRISVRHSITLLDSPGAKALRKLSIEPGAPEMFLNEEALRAHLLAGGEAGKRIHAHIDRLLNGFDALHNDVRAADGGLEPLFSKARERIAHELERIAEKAAASAAQREGAALQRAHLLSNLVRPRGEAQERVLSAGSFLYRYPQLPAELLEHLRMDSAEHLVMVLD